MTFFGPRSGIFGRETKALPDPPPKNGGGGGNYPAPYFPPRCVA